MEEIKKIRILHLIEDLGRGGAEKRLLNDLKNLDGNRFVNYVYYLFPNNALEEEFNLLGIQTRQLNFKNGVVNFISIVKLLFFIKSEEIDIIHTQLFYADILGRIIGFVTHRPVITTVQSSIYEANVDFLYSKKRLLVDRLTSRLFNTKFIAVSEFVRSSLKKMFGLSKEKISVIFNSVEDELNYLDHSLVRNYIDRFRRNPETRILLTVGKLNPGKGHIYLIEALAELVDRNVLLLIAGEGFLQSQLVSYANELGIENRVSFLGEVKDIRELISMSDIFVFPSLSEGMPISLLEAMVQEKPVVAFKIEPICEVIEDGINGMLVPIKDSKGLADAIEDLLENPDKAKRLGRAARDLMLKKFNAKLNAEKLGIFYESIMNNGVR